MIVLWFRSRINQPYDNKSWDIPIHALCLETCRNICVFVAHDKPRDIGCPNPLVFEVVFRECVDFLILVSKIHWILMILGIMYTHQPFTTTTPILIHFGRSFSHCCSGHAEGLAGQGDSDVAGIYRIFMGIEWVHCQTIFSTRVRSEW